MVLFPFMAKTVSWNWMKICYDQCSYSVLTPYCVSLNNIVISYRATLLFIVNALKYYYSVMFHKYRKKKLRKKSWEKVCVCVRNFEVVNIFHSTIKWTTHTGFQLINQLHLLLLLLVILQKIKYIYTFIKKKKNNKTKSKIH